MWDDASCRDRGRLFPEADWFPERENSVAGKKAIKVCRHCPVAAACLDQALKGETLEIQRIGIFAGMTADDRRAAFGPLTSEARRAAGWHNVSDPVRAQRWLVEFENGTGQQEIAAREGVSDRTVQRGIANARKVRDAA